MDAFERAGVRNSDLARGGQRLAWLSPAPPQVGMCVRGADGARIGQVVDLVVGGDGTFLAVCIAFAGTKPALVKRVAPEALRQYGDGLVCCFFRAEVQRFPS